LIGGLPDGKYSDDYFGWIYSPGFSRRCRFARFKVRTSTEGGYAMEIRIFKSDLPKSITCTEYGFIRFAKWDFYGFSDSDDDDSQTPVPLGALTVTILIHAKLVAR